MFPDAETTAVVAEAMVPFQGFEVLFSLLIGFVYNSFFGNNQVDILNKKLESLQRQLEFKLDLQEINLGGKIDRQEINLAGKIDRQEVKLGGKIDRQEVKLERLIAKLERMDRKWMR